MCITAGAVPDVAGTVRGAWLTAVVGDSVSRAERRVEVGSGRTTSFLGAVRTSVKIPSPIARSRIKIGPSWAVSSSSTRNARLILCSRAAASCLVVVEPARAIPKLCARETARV